MNDKIPNMDYDADEVIDSFKSKFKWPDKDDVEVVVKPKNLPKKILLSLLTTVIVGAGAYYMMIPALNFKSTDFYTFIFLLIAVFVGSFFLFIGGNKRAESSAYFKKKSVVPIVLVVVILAVMLVGWLVGCTFFRAKDYSNLVTVQESDFSEDFPILSTTRCHDLTPRPPRFLQTSNSVR